MIVTGKLEVVVESAGGMSVRVCVGHTLPPLVTPIYEDITDVRPEWARVALRAAAGKTVTIETNEAGDVIRTTVRA